MPTADRWLSTPRPDPLAGLVDCPDCRVHAAANPLLGAAVASVAISHGTTTGETLRRYLAVYHRRGHTDETGGRPR